MAKENALVPFPDNSDLSEQIHFRQKEGKIWLDEQRVVLDTLPALAGLWLEVMETLGQERAKGFFLRMGHKLGVADAELARKLRPDAAPADMFLAGPQLHMLRGMVKVEPMQLEIDTDIGHFYMEHVWVDSYEVEICQREKGLLNEPVCWNLLGYACGYSSAVLGKEIIFKEVECRGCGDNHCRCIGKPAHEWEDHLEFKKYFASDPIIDQLYELQSQVTELRVANNREDLMDKPIGASQVFQKVNQMAHKAAVSRVSVLLTGETGVGKEVMAQSIHMASDRSKQPFVALNCAAIPPDLIEAELFGVAKGAYTGATASREGRFERADSGTIFLDEVVELSARAQASLLRVLQEREFERVGDNKVRNIDVRVIAASNEDLGVAVKEGRFRADLYYRLNVFPVHIPPLRERREDIPLLVEHFLEKFHALYNKKTLGLSNKAMHLVMDYAWPGNIRELINIIERGIIMTDNNHSVDADSLFPGIELQTGSGDGREDVTLSPSGELETVLVERRKNASGNWLDAVFTSQIPLEEIEHSVIKQAMSLSDDNVSKAARLLGMTRPALAYRLTKMTSE